MTTTSIRSRARPIRPRTGNQARAAATRERILDETVACILEDGYAAASAKRIAERAGVTWGVVQYHFGDRDGILAEVVERGLHVRVETMSSTEIPEAPLRARVEALVETGWTAYSSPLTRAGLEILVATRTRRDRPGADQLEPFGQEVARLARRISPDADGTAGRLLLLALRGLALDQLLMPRPLDSRRDRAAIVDMVVRLLES